MLCFTAHCFRAAPTKSAVAQSSAHQCDKRQSHISSSTFSSLLLVLPGLGGAGYGPGRGAGRISRIVFYDEWTSWAPPAPPSHFISIERLSTLQSHYLHYLHYIYRVIIYIIYLQISSPAWQGGGGHVTVLQFAQMKLQFSWSPSNWDASTVSRTPEITPALQKYLLSTANDHLRKYMVVFKHTVCIFV